MTASNMQIVTPSIGCKLLIPLTIAKGFELQVSSSKYIVYETKQGMHSLKADQMTVVKLIQNRNRI